MRVLHFAGSYFPVPGGTTVRLHNMLASPENEHLLVVPWPIPSQCPEDFNKISKDEVKGHISICRVDFPRAIKWSRRIPFLGNCIQAHQFAKKVQHEESDILHGHNPRACAIASLRMKQKTSMPMVYEAHGIMQDQANLAKHFGSAETLNKVAVWLDIQSAAYVERKILRIADQLIVQTESVKRRLIELYSLDNKPIEIIRNGVDTDKFNPERWRQQGLALRRKHGWCDRVVCLYAGYLDVVNGIEFTLNAVSQLSEDAQRKLKIVLLGRGPLQDKVLQMREQFTDLVDYHGLVKYEQMPAYYAASDVFMIPRPSYEQAETLLPMKLLEAMAMEKIALVSNVAAMAEVVTDGENALVFEKGIVDDFIDKLEIITRQANAFERLGRQARKDVLAEYTWEKARRRLQEIYNELLKGRVVAK